METATLLESFFLQVETVTAMSGNQFLNTELILLVETDFLASGNYFLLTLCHIFFKESFIPKELYCFLLRAFFPTSENHYLNYGEVLLPY